MNIIAVTLALCMQSLNPQVSLRSRRSPPPSDEELRSCTPRPPPVQPAAAMTSQATPGSQHTIHTLWICKFSLQLRKEDFFFLNHLHFTEEKTILEK